MPLDSHNANPSGANYREIFADLRTQLPPLPDEDPAASMSRQSDAALRSLLRIQARREKQKAGYWFKSVAVPPNPPAAAPPLSDQAVPLRTETRIDAEAEPYAVMYPDRAARIRSAGGLPARLDFGPPE